MKNTFIILGICSLIFLCFIGSCSYMIYDNYKNFPEYAQKDKVYEQYATFMKAIDTSIETSNSIFDLAAKLEKVNHPHNLIYLALQKKGDFHNRDNDTIEIIKNFNHNSSKSTFSSNGTGYGKVNGRDIIIIQHPIAKHEGLEECIIYLEYHKPTQVTN